MRLKNVFRNSFFSVLSQIILIFVGFFSQRVMNLRMGEELVGMNGVISNIISILSVSELGIASAIVYHLYRALNEKNEQQIAALMNLYRRAYYIFAAVITGLGLIVMPFVPLFLKDNSFSLEYIRIVYCLWLVRTVLSYLLSYKRSILIADQREYIVSIITLTANVLNYLTVIVILELLQNYILVLCINIIVEAVLNILISCYVDRKYPFLVKMKKEPLDKKVVLIVWRDIKNIFVTRLSSKILGCTDNMIISGFISVAAVGLYSNYCLITQSLLNIVTAFSNALQPSVGNMFIEGDNEKNYKVLRQITFVFFLMASFAAASLFSLVTPFVADFWLSRSYQLPMEVVLCCVMNLFLVTLGMPLAMMMGVTGLFDRERNLSLIVAAVNLVFSLTLVKPLGIVGVLAGTFASYCIQIIFRIRVFFRQYLNISCRRYVGDMLQYCVLAALETGVTYMLTVEVYRQGSFLSFLLLMIICVILPNMMNCVIFIRSWRLKSLVGILRDGKALCKKS